MFAENTQKPRSPFKKRSEAAPLRPEGEGGQIRLVPQIPVRIVGPGVADRQGNIHLRTRKKQRVSFDPGLLRGMEHAVPSRQEESFRFVSLKMQSFAIPEHHAETVSFDTALFEDRAAGRHGAVPVDVIKGGLSQSAAHILLVLGVDVIRFADIQRGDQIGFRQIAADSFLCLPQKRPGGSFVEGLVRNS